MAAGDFYFAINATFRFFLRHHGEEGLRRYWTAMGTEHYAPLAERFREGGLPAVEQYWADFFRQEPGGDVVVSRSPEEVTIDVRDCPAIRWLRENNRDIVGPYCEHCHHVSSAIAGRAGMGFQLEGGGGTCRQHFTRAEPAP
jgi:hypothetical protein